MRDCLRMLVNLPTERLPATKQRRDRRANLQRYVKSYRKYPETADEVAEAEQLAILAWEEIPWEEE